MTTKEIDKFINSVLYPLDDYNIYFNRDGRIALVLTNDNSYLNEIEMFEFLLKSVSAYDLLESTAYIKIREKNNDITTSVIHLFGIEHANNPYFYLIDDVYDVSHKIVMKLWYHIHKR